MVEARKRFKKIPFRGIFPGAKVVRGLDWQWNEQDESLKGKVVSIRDWNETSFQSGALVQWENGCKNLYRLGFNGMVCNKIKKIKQRYFLRVM